MQSRLFKKCEDPLDLEYRKERVAILAEEWNLVEVRPLILEYKIPQAQLSDLLSSVNRYVHRCLQVVEDSYNNSCSKVRQLQKLEENVTPNGACVPKREYQFLYNDVLQNWFSVFKTMILKNESILKLVRVTPNIRIKYGRELSDNENRGLNTQLPHSDAWVEGPWGFNVFTPLLGDCENNTLRYYNSQIMTYQIRFSQLWEVTRKNRYYSQTFGKMKRLSRKPGTFTYQIMR